jgi:hypothetical protein
MQLVNSLSDSDLLLRMPVLVLHERSAIADVIEHLVEIDRRDLYLGQACSTLAAYCRERLGYSEDEASKRVRVARFARAVPAALEELREGRIHLTGLFVLSHYANPGNAGELMAEARGKTRRELEQVLAARFPKPNVEEKIERTIAPNSDVSNNGGASHRSHPLCPVRPLSADTFAVQFTAGVDLKSKIDRAKELLSHSIPDGDLARIFERALDELIARTLRHRVGGERLRARRMHKAGSRHVPVEHARAVWERDCGQCTFVDEQGRRCSERRFITIEHRHPFARGGASDPENLCLLCEAHNQYNARLAYGAEFIALKRRERARNRRPRSSSMAAASATEAAERQTAVEADATTVTFEPAQSTESGQSTEPAQFAERIQCAEPFTVEPGDAACATTRANQAPISPTGVADATRSNSSSQSPVRDKVLAALCGLGFRRNEACAALRDLNELETDSAALLRAALQRLTPPAIHGRTPA